MVNPWNKNDYKWGKKYVKIMTDPPTNSTKVEGGMRERNVL